MHKERKTDTLEKIFNMTYIAHDTERRRLTENPMQLAIVLGFFKIWESWLAIPFASMDSQLVVRIRYIPL